MSKTLTTSCQYFFSHQDANYRSLLSQVAWWWCQGGVTVSRLDSDGSGQRALARLWSRELGGLGGPGQGKTGIRQAHFSQPCPKNPALALLGKQQLQAHRHRPMTVGHCGGFWVLVAPLARPGTGDKDVSLRCSQQKNLKQKKKKELTGLFWIT